MNETPMPKDSLLRRLGDIWLTYLRGQMFMALIVGVLMWTINAGVGMSSPLLMGVVAGLLQGIPTFGPLVSALIAAIVALVGGSSVIGVEPWVFALIVLGVYLLVQQLVTLFLEPHVMGKRLNLPPVVVFVSVLAGAAIGNVIGAVVAVPVVASVREILKEMASPQSPR